MTDGKLHYELIQTRNLRFEVATAGQGDDLALLLHGFPESAHSYRNQIPLLTRLGYRVWAPNLRGYGRSDRPRGRSAYTLDLLQQDVTDLIDESGARSVVLVGHDWGGLIGWHYASYGARPLARLVVLNCPHPACFRENFSLAQLRRSSYMLWFQLPLAPERAIRANDFAALRKVFRTSLVHRERMKKEDLEVYLAQVREPGALTAMLNYYRALPIWMARAGRRRPKRISTPTLLVWGEQDAALGTELTHGTEAYVRDLTVRYVPDASHWIQQDTPETVNAVLEAWLRERTDRGESEHTLPASGPNGS